MHVKNAFFFNIVISNSAIILQLLPVEQNDKVLGLNRRISLLDLHFILHICYCILTLHIKRDRSARDLQKKKNIRARYQKGQGVEARRTVFTKICTIERSKQSR